MTVRRGSVLACVAVVLLLSVGAATASSGPPVIPIPGFVAPALRVGGVARTSDGGAIVAASQREPGASGWQPTVIRLRVDGSIDLGYGTEGISRPRLGADMSATAAAIDPRSGDAWVATTRPAGRSAIVALNGDGVRVTRFAQRGILWRGAASAPVALAWQAGRLLIASGGSPCTGCQLSVVDPSTGAPIADGRLTPRELSAGPSCGDGAITSAVLTDPRTAQLAFRGGPHCGERIVTISLPGRDGHSGLRPTRSVPLGDETFGTDLVAASGSNLCVATASPASSAFGPLLAPRHVVLPSRAPGGRLIALVALGPGACAALIVEAHHPVTVVAQASVQRRQATLDAVPRAVQALGMFRCHAHLLVLGAHRQGGQSSGVVVAIAVRRGPNAAATTAAVVRAAAPRCH